MLRYKLSQKRRSINVEDNTTVVKNLDVPKDMKALPYLPSMTMAQSITPPSNLFTNKKRKLLHDDVDSSNKSSLLSALQAASDIAASTPPTTIPSSNSIRKGTRPSPWRKVMIHRRDNDDSDDIKDTPIFQPRRLSFSSCENTSDDEVDTTSHVDDDASKTTVDDEVLTVPTAVSPTASIATVYDSEGESSIKPTVVSPSISDSEDESINKPRRVSFYSSDDKELDDNSCSSSSTVADRDNESIAASVLIGLKNSMIFNDNIIDKTTVITEPPKKKQRRISKSKIDKTVIHGGMQFHHEKDEEHVNSLHCFVREELLEVFVVGNPDKNGDKDGGQVGIRCKYCVGTKSRGAAANGAGTMRYFFPPNVETIYQRTCTWQRLHFPFCNDIPQHLVEKYHHLKATDKTRGRKAHWAWCAKGQGMRNSEEPRGGVFYHADKVKKAHVAV